MILPKVTSLFLSPAKQNIEARIVPLTDQLLPKINPGWWEDSCLSQIFHHMPIDRDWDWVDAPIDFDGRVLASKKVAIVTGDGEVQGAAIVSIDAVDSLLESGKGALFLERLFTAPRNRPDLRQDNSPYYLGVGVELLIWAVQFSRKMGHAGRIRLDSSPDAIAWYEKRGLKKLRLDRMLFEGVEYAPMELPAAAAKSLLALRSKMRRPKK